MDYSNLLRNQRRYDEAVSLLDSALNRLPKRGHSVIKRQRMEIIEERNNRKKQEIIDSSIPRFEPSKRGPIFVQGKSVDLEERHDCEFKEVKGSNPVGSITSVVDEYVVAWLNSMKSGGKIFWGIRNEDRVVVGINVDYRMRDEIRRIVTEKLFQINPKIAPTSVSVEFHQIKDSHFNLLQDHYVLEVSVPEPSPNVILYATGKGEVFIKTDSGKKKLDVFEMQAEIIKRQNLIQ